jgi:hypothetical protein
MTVPPQSEMRDAMGRETYLEYGYTQRYSERG